MAFYSSNFKMFYFGGMYMSKHKENNKNKKDEELELVVLKAINNQQEFNIISVLLKDNEIPFMVKDYGSGGYMRIIGRTSIYRTDILVEKSMFEKAKALLDELPPEIFN